MNMTVKYRKSSHNNLNVLWTLNYRKTQREGIHQLNNQMPYLPQLKFELDLLWNQRFWVWSLGDSNFWTLLFCSMRSYSIDVTCFLFIWWKIWFLEKTWSRHLFLLYLFKGKQNKKENLKCDSLFEKYDLWKTKTGFWD